MPSTTTASKIKHSEPPKRKNQPTKTVDKHAAPAKPTKWGQELLHKMDVFRRALASAR